MSMKSLVARIVLLGLVDVIVIQLALALGSNITPVLGIAIIVFTIIANVAFLSERLYPWRWVIPALAGMFLLVVYPIGYSVVVAFTNYGDGHLLQKQQVIDLRLAETYAPEGAPTYKVYVYRSDATEDFRFWLVDSNGKTFFYAPGQEALTEVAPDDVSLGARDDNGIPTTLDGFNRLPPGGALRFSETLQNIAIDAGDNTIKITRLGIAEAQEAKELQSAWRYDPATDTLTDLQSGKVYRAERGNFITGEGETREVMQPGFPDFIGLDNVIRVVTDPTIRDPFWRVFLWTLAFAAGSVATTLGLGLLFALLLNSPDLPFRILFRSILIIPYAVPGWLVVTTWAGLMNPVYGPFNILLKSIFGISPQWFSDPGLAKVAILFVNLYLGFPYMMLISLGALQSIPSDMYEAATIDGATIWEQFRSITFPLLLIALAPLLVASFSFNFNNFTIIELMNKGGPPIGAATVAGHTDILLSYTYRLAFAGGTGTNYGFAAAIGIFIFMIVGPITYFNFRLTRRLEEVS
ncbi:MAG: maltose ABC transporter permease MalF [Chloroflexi bacterium]|nr:maltose ABC transporter permease MalF [Chloroflexota bacterium]MCC6896432.1 maltose ABC transporter permease MalF [Anaerolineae bacterium]